LPTVVGRGRDLGPAVDIRWHPRCGPPVTNAPPPFSVVELWHAALEKGDLDWFTSLNSPQVVLTGLGPQVAGLEQLISILGTGEHDFKLLRLYARDETVVAKQHHEIHDPETHRLIERIEGGSVFIVQDGSVTSIEICPKLQTALKKGDLRTADEQHPATGAWRIWNAFRLGHPLPQRAEFAMYSDSQFEDELRALGPFSILNTDPRAGIRTGQAKVALVLRAEMTPLLPRTAEGPRKQMTAAWHGGGPADELAALISLALGVRLQNGGPTRYWIEGKDPLGQPSIFQQHAVYLPPPRFDRAPMLPGVAREACLVDAQPLLSSFPGLPAASASSLVRAARQYSAALWEADGDPNLSWLRLVGALEAAAESLPGAKETDFQILSEGWPEMAKTLGEASGSVRDRIAALLKRQTMVTWKVKRFVSLYAPDPPPVRPTAAHERFDWGGLPKALATIYGHRSAALHGGRPFPAFMCLPPPCAEGDKGPPEVPLGGGWSGDASWADDEVPMYLHMFAHIVRQSLLRWWQHTASAQRS